MTMRNLTPDTAFACIDISFMASNDTGCHNVDHSLRTGKLFKSGQEQNLSYNVM